MIRLSGIQLLAVSIVLWALAVWMFGAPPPAETETVTETTTGATGEPGVGANESADTAPDSASTAQASATAASDSSPGTGDSLPRAAPKHAGAAAGSATPGTETQVPAEHGPTTLAAAAPPSTGIESPGASPVPPPDSAPGRTADDALGPGALPVAPPPHPWFEHPRSLPPPPQRPRYPVAGGDPAAGQIEAGRRAAWEGRYAEALAHYRAAARLRPGHYVVWGEMGNVLWAMRRWREAAYALEGAATLLVRAGELRAARELVPAVGRIDQQAAYRIEQLLWTATRRESG